MIDEPRKLAPAGARVPLGRAPRSRAAVVVAALIGLVASLLASPPARAATLDVCQSGCSYTSIQAAIDAATAGDTIDVRDGVHNGTVTVTKDLIIEGATTAAAVVVDGTGAGSTVRVASGVTATIRDVTITGGAAPDGAGVDNAGTLTLERVEIRGNTATDSGELAIGGGVRTTGRLTVSDSVVEGNTADRGGGIASDDAVVVIERTTVRDNVARISGGGGLANGGTEASMTLRDSVVAGNEVTAPGTDFRGGGGVWSSLADLLVEDSEIRDNTSGWSAGGLYVNGSSATVTIRRTTISGNLTGTDRAAGDGGGMSARGSANVTIEDSTISGNTAASSGGGMESDARMTVRNSTISGNVAGSSGGGVIVRGALTMDSVTVAANTARYTGGVAAPRTPALRNVVIADNSSDEGSPDCSGELFTAAGQVVVVEDPAGCSFRELGTFTTGVDPALGPLANNGGVTATHLPGATSILVDRGATVLSTDQRGEQRPVGGGVDVGAVEVQTTSGPVADLGVVLSPTSLDIDAGRSRDYELTVFNNGPDAATSVRAVLDFSGPVEPLSLPSECGFETATSRVVCELTVLAVGGLRTFVATLRFPTGGDQTVVATVDADEDDLDPSDDEVVGLVQVLGSSGADVAAVLGAQSGINGDGVALDGGEVVLNVGAASTGPNIATSVEVEVTLPDGWSLLASDPRCTATTPGGQVVRCVLGDLARPVDPRLPTTALAQLRVVPTADGTIETTVSTSATDPDPSNDTTRLAVEVRATEADVDVRVVTEAASQTVVDEASLGPRFGIYATPDIPVEPSFRVTVSPVDDRLVGVTLVGLDQDEWRCVENRGAILTIDCSATGEPLFTTVIPTVRVNRPGDWDVTLTAGTGIAYDPDTSNDTASRTLRFTQPPPLRLRAIEVNQAVQDWDLSVPLYAGRRTAVRVFTEYPDSPRTEVKGRLHASRGGVPLTPPSVAPINGRADVPTDATVRRDLGNRSLNFLLPAAWMTEGPLSLRFEHDTVDDNRSLVCAEPDGTADCTVEVDVLPGEVVPLDLGRVQYTTDDSQVVRIQPTGDTLPSGTWRFVDGTRTSAPLDVASTSVEVQAAIESLYGYPTNLVDVRQLPSTGPTVGWRVRLRTGIDEPALGVSGDPTSDPADPGLTGGTVSAATRYDGGRVVGTSVGTVVDQIGRLESALPIAGIDLRHFSMTFTDRRPFLDTEVNPALERRRLVTLTGCQDCRPLDLRVGAFLDGAGSNFGFAGLNNGAVWSAFTAGIVGTGTGYSRNIGAHELAHSYGQPHAAVEQRTPGPGDPAPEGSDTPYGIGLCGSTSPADADRHPYVEDIGGTDINSGLVLGGYTDTTFPTIGPLGAGPDREVWGIDTRVIGTGNPTLALVSPRGVAALMSYCGGVERRGQVKWTAANEYAGIHAGVVADTVGVQRGGTAADRIVVTGTVGDGATTVDPVVGTVGLDVTQPEGPVEVALVTDDGSVLDSASVALQGDATTTERSPDGALVTIDTQLFSAVLDAPTGDVAALVVRRDGVEVARRAASVTAPSVRITAPTASTTVGDDGLRIAWDADDADGDELRATVAYSPDGATWRTLAVDLERDELLVALGELGGGDRAQVRVTVSDGLRTASATTAPFVVADAPPTVEIVSPSPGATVGADEGVVLDLVAFDAETGLLATDTATWTSDIDGELGTGAPLVLPAGALGVGCHTLSTTLTDPAGTPGTATTVVGVGVACPASAADGTLVVRQLAPVTPAVRLPFTAGEESFDLADGEERTINASGDVTVVQAPPPGWSTTVRCEDPSGGTAADAVLPLATVDLDPGETVVCTFTTLPPDAPPVGEVSPSTTTVQVGDALAPVTFTVTDPDSRPEQLSLEVDGLPAGLEVADQTCAASGDGSLCRTTIAGTAAGPPEVASVVLTASDGTTSTRTTATVVVAPEDASLRLFGPNRTRVSVDPGESASFELRVRTVETDPDTATGTPGPTDLAGATVSIRLDPLAPGPAIAATSCTDRLLGDDGDDQTLVTTCAFDGVEPDVHLVTAVAGGSVTGTVEDVLAVTERSPGAARGGGEVVDPLGRTTGFDLALATTRRGTNAGGTVTATITEPDGSQHTVRSTSITGLVLGDLPGGGAWAAVTGRAVHTAPGLDPTGGLRFSAYVEDGELDRFWLEIIDRDGHVVASTDPSGRGVDGALTVSDGVIDVARDLPRTSGPRDRGGPRGGSTARHVA